VQDPLTTSAVNIEGTLNVLLAARDATVRRVVFASSSSVYGASPALPKQEDHQPLPVSPYGVSKLSAEQYCRAFAGVYGLETVSLRLFNVFGPGQDPLSQYAAVVPRFIAALSTGTPATIYGDGQQTRDFTFVGDVVEAFVLAVDKPEASGEVFNVCVGAETSLLELMDTLCEFFESPEEPRFERARAGEVRRSYGDPTKAAGLLGWRPQWSFTDGLRECLPSTLSPARPA
jgi:UDP-glucose 4-epimerase